MTSPVLRSRSGRRLLLLVGALLCLEPRAHAAGASDEAELHFQMGADRYGRGDFVGALEHFLISNRLAPNRNVTFNIARAYENLSRFPESYRYYVRAIEGETEAATHQSIEDAIARVSPNVAVLAVESDPPGATLYVDREDLGTVGVAPTRLGLTAGRYKILATLDGYEPASTEPIALALGARVPVRLTLRRIVGQVRVTGAAGYAVHVDDEDAPAACTSPCTLEVVPGAHVLLLKKPGFAVVPRQVSVAARETVTIKASVVALTGSVVVSSDEPNALVEIDGRPVGFTPAVIPGIAVGRRVVRVSLRGYQPIEREIEVRVNQQTDLRGLRLTAIREIVAASRRVEALEDAPASVTVISSQELAAFGYPTILEALRGVRGFATTYDSIYGNASVRGLGQPNDFTNRMLVLGDGAVLNENILYQPFTHFDGRVDLDDVDRIEIVRGPGSVLYGTGAVSGVVNLVTRSRDEPSGATVATSAVGDVARARASTTLQLGRDAGVWASFAAARSDGRTQALRLDEDGDGRDDVVDVHAFDRFSAYTAAGRAWWRDLTAQWFFTNRRVHIPTGSFGTVLDRDDNVYTDERFLLELRFEPRLNEQVQLLTRAHLNRGTFVLGYVFDAEEDTPEGPVAWVQPYAERYAGTWVGGEARIVYEPTPRLRLSLGSELVHHFEVTMTASQREFDATTTRILDVDAPYSVLAGYGVVEWAPRRAFRASLGLRADYWNLSGDTLSDATGLPLAEDFVSLNPRLALIGKPSKRDTLKLMAGRAFRAPSTYEYYYTDGGLTQAASDCCGHALSPETVYSLELEATHAFSETWTGVASTYVMIASNVIETVRVPESVRTSNGWEEGIAYYRNSDVDQRFLGADLELRREWSGGIMATGQVGALQAAASSAPNVGDPTLSQEARVPNAPRVYAAFKGVVPLVRGLVNGALRTTVEAPRRIDASSDDVTETAVITDLVLSGAFSGPGVRYHLGLYNAMNWRYELPASPFASRLMPQQARTLLLGVSLTR